MKEIKVFEEKIKSLIILILLLSIFSSTGCKTISNSMDSWVGHTKAELYQKWGPPTRVTDDGQGGEILIYEQYVNMGQTEGRVYYDNNGNIKYTNPQQSGYTKTRMFYVNKQGKIYYWRWQGL